MSKKIYSQAEIQALRNNPNVKSVTEKSITYSSEFKIKAIKQSKQGMKSTQIFELAGMVNHLCDLAGVSKSGYYYWLNSSDKRAERDRNDWEDFQLLYRIFLDKKKCGIDEIKMALETEYDVVMNHKKIRRILRKNNIISSIRAAKPYRKM